MKRFRSLWRIVLFTGCLWLIIPQSALTASMDQFPAPTPTVILGDAPVIEYPPSLYPEMIYAAIAILAIIAIGNVLIRLKNR